MTVFDRFLEAARTHADQPAVLGPAGTATYAALESIARRAASALHPIAPAATGPVAVSLPPGPELYGLFLGVLAAGGSYVYLDPTASTEDAGKLLRASRAVAVMGCAGPAENGLVRVSLEAVRASPPAATAGPDRTDAAGLPAVHLLSSGSTAAPRGFAISQGTVLRQYEEYRRYLRITDRDRICLATSPRFAASNSPTYGALLSGATLCPFPIIQDGLRAWVDWLAATGITVLHLTPSLFRALTRHMKPGGLPQVRIIKLGGESACRRDAELFETHFPGPCELVNGLGLSEAGGGTTEYRHTRGIHPDPDRIPVGKPFEGIDLTLEDSEGHAVAPGAEGEIVIRSAWVRSQSWGGANRGAGEPLRTGDRGRWLADGSLMHLGRTDRVVKIRGQQIDLNDVEAALRAVEGVHNAAAILREGEQPRIEAWVETGDRMTAPEVTEALRKRGLAALVPHRIRCVRAIPLTPGGKIDRTALLENAAGTERTRRTPPRNAWEQRVAGVWSEVLGIPEPGVYESFFALGGDSLQALELLAGLSREFGCRCQPHLLLHRPTIAQLAEAFAGGCAGNEPQPWARRFEEVLHPLHAGDAALRVVCFPGGYATEGDLLIFARLFALADVACTAFGVRFNATAPRTLPLTLRPAIRRIARALAPGVGESGAPGAPVVFLGECIASALAIQTAARYARLAACPAPPVILLDPFHPRARAKVPAPEPLLPASPIGAYTRLVRGLPVPIHAGDLHIVCAAESGRAADCAAWWGPRTAGACRIYITKGDHHSYLRQDAPALAKVLRDILGALAVEDRVGKRRGLA